MSINTASMNNPFDDFSSSRNVFRQKMIRETSRGRRLCRLCNEPIKKGQKCFTIRVRGQVWTRGIHIHESHIKALNPKNCSHKMECITGKYYCNLQLCKLNRR
jgi:hypothetical protein